MKRLRIKRSMDFYCRLKKEKAKQIGGQVPIPRQTRTWHKLSMEAERGRHAAYRLLEVLKSRSHGLR